MSTFPATSGTASRANVPVPVVTSRITSPSQTDDLFTARPGSIEEGLRILGVPAYDRFKVSDAAGTSYRGPCPICGGTRRFVVYANQWPWWFAECGNCEQRGLLLDLFGDGCAKRWKPDPVMEAMRKAERERLEHEREETRERKLAALQSDHAYWLSYHKSMTDENKQWWRGRGLDDELQWYYRLGACRRAFDLEGQLVDRNAYSIPKFQRGTPSSHPTPLNVDYRIVFEPGDDASWGKYRGESKLKQVPFLARYDWDDWLGDGIVFVVEGAIKAAVLHYRGVREEHQVIGLPGKKSWCGIENELKVAKKVYILFDPDADAAAWQLALRIGMNAYIVRLQAKPDDWLLEHGGNRDKLARIVKFGAECPAKVQTR